MRLWQEGSQQSRWITRALLGLGPEDLGSPDDFPAMADEFGNLRSPTRVASGVSGPRAVLARAMCSMYKLDPAAARAGRGRKVSRFSAAASGEFPARRSRGCATGGSPLDDGPNPPVLASVTYETAPPGGYGAGTFTPPASAT